MQHPSTMAWERKLTAIFRDVDRLLEEQFGQSYPLHPARAQVGAAANPGHDGLFRLTAKFTLGHGSALGAGYILDLDVMTLDRVTAGDRAKFEAAAAEAVRVRLPSAFPGLALSVDRDGPKFKVYGDLNLGKM